MTKRILNLKGVAIIFSCFAMAALSVSCGQSSNSSTTANAMTTETQAANSTETQTAPSQTAVDVALKFINLYVENSLKTNESIDLVEWVIASELATQGFKTEVKTMIEKAFEEEPDMGLGFDPIIDGQDFPDEGFELESYDSESNYIVVKGKKWSDFKVTIKMVLEGNKWLVDGCGVVNIPKDKQSPR